jgi:hypothetical protein
VIAFALTGATEQWSYLCSLTNAYNARATIAGAAAVIFEGAGIMPKNNWFQAQVKTGIEKAKGEGVTAKGKPASVYLATIVDMSEKLIRFHNPIEKDAVANILKTAKATLAKIEKIEAKAKADKAAADKAAKDAKAKAKADAKAAKAKK